MAGDRLIDILLGREAGIFTIGVPTGHPAREDFQAARANLILSIAAKILYILF